eukprot:CAMPEP_0177629086 /NCGR_PEP_ID=MMETSP0447-20121125/480_1 /TAXON_ID=0 /ORGANISM="Stygamoeba regulata, Strain BSH-02190019" /LENGTH=329 /DNA_ID=CAMNT_0019130383 /DNA_START=120 /DNA_END=1109 /DNA_ORIENTATION=-
MASVIIDTDPGIDDAMAIILACASDKIKLEALTLVMGNHDDMSVLGRNARAILKMLRREDVEIIPGSAVPLTRPYSGQSGKLVHGPDALGGCFEKFFSGDDHAVEHDGDNNRAAEYIVKMARQRPGEITLITLGPLTNLARAYNLCNDLPTLLKAVYTMGGAINHAGNKTPVAEANFENDPEASRIVMNAGFDILIAPLNVTHQVHMDPAFRSRIQDIPVVGEFIFQITHHYVNILTGWGTHEDEIPMHDSCAVMALIAPHVFTKVHNVYVDVETEGRRTSGMCVADWRGHYKHEEAAKRHRTRVLFGVDQGAFKGLYLDLLERLGGRL